MRAFCQGAAGWAAIWLLWAGAGATGAAAEEEPSPRERFLQAGAAYDQADYPEAMSRYEGLVEDGWVSAAVLYNLGNAQYRTGNPAAAAVQYRRAWQLAPRDREIRANLTYVLDQTEAVRPEANPFSALVFAVSAGEYARIGVAAYWGLAALFIGSRFLRFLSPWLVRAAPPLGLVLAWAAFGLGSWVSLQDEERMVTAPDQHALYAPLDSSQTHFALPLGSIVREVDQTGPWIKVHVNGNSGWIRSSAVVSVYPVSSG